MSSETTEPPAATKGMAEGGDLKICLFSDTLTDKLTSDFAVMVSEPINFVEFTTLKELSWLIFLRPKSYANFSFSSNFFQRLVWLLQLFQSPTSE